MHSKSCKKKKYVCTCTKTYRTTKEQAKSRKSSVLVTGDSLNQLNKFYKHFALRVWLGIEIQSTHHQKIEPGTIAQDFLMDIPILHENVTTSHKLPWYCLVWPSQFQKLTKHTPNVSCYCTMIYTRLSR